MNWLVVYGIPTPLKVKWDDCSQYIYIYLYIYIYVFIYIYMWKNMMRIDESKLGVNRSRWKWTCLGYSVSQYPRPQFPRTTPLATERPTMAGDHHSRFQWNECSQGMQALERSKAGCKWWPLFRNTLKHRTWGPFHNPKTTCETEKPAWN